MAVLEHSESPRLEERYKPEQEDEAAVGLHVHWVHSQVLAVDAVDL